MAPRAAPPAASPPRSPARRAPAASTPTPRPPHGDRRRDILDAALQLVEREGVKALTQPRLAKALGLRTSHLTYYYPKKADLLGAVLEASHARATHAAPSVLDGAEALLFEPERLRVWLASVLEASADPHLADVLRQHMAAFEAQLAGALARAPGDAAVADALDQLRGAGLRRLVDPSATHDVAQLAARHGLVWARTEHEGAHATTPGGAPPKRFDDADAYRADIAQVLPGHELARQLAIAALQSAFGAAGTLWISGCGPGDELIELAAALPGWQLEAVDPSKAMRDSATALVCAHGLAARVRVHEAPPERLCDAALSLFVAHLLAAPERARYWQQLGRVVRPGGLLLLAEIEPVGRATLAQWQAFSRARGASEARLEQLAQRLRGGFVPLTHAETKPLAAAAGFRPGKLLLRALRVTLRSWVREGA